MYRNDVTVLNDMSGGEGSVYTLCTRIFILYYYYYYRRRVYHNIVTRRELTKVAVHLMRLLLNT